MNQNHMFKLKVNEDELRPYLVIPTALKRGLKLKKHSEATMRLVSSKGKLVFEITPN